MFAQVSEAMVQRLAQMPLIELVTGGWKAQELSDSFQLSYIIQGNISIQKIFIL